MGELYKAQLALRLRVPSFPHRYPRIGGYPGMKASAEGHRHEQPSRVDAMRARVSERPHSADGGTVASKKRRQSPCVAVVPGHMMLRRTDELEVLLRGNKTAIDRAAPASRIAARELIFCLDPSLGPISVSRLGARLMKTKMNIVVRGLFDTVWAVALAHRRFNVPLAVWISWTMARRIRRSAALRELSPAADKTQHNCNMEDNYAANSAYVRGLEIRWLSLRRFESDLPHHLRPGAGKGRVITRSHTGEAIERLLVELFLEAHSRAPRQIVLDLDATDDPLHGKQEGRFFHGYYDCYCYLPLYIFCGRHLLVAKLRPFEHRCMRRCSAGSRANSRSNPGALAAVRIVLRADSGFAREELMAWCEHNAVDYVFGLARNERLRRRLVDGLARGARRCRSGRGSRRGCFAISLRHARQLVPPPSGDRQGRADGRQSQPPLHRHLARGEDWRAKPSTKKLYCARGEMENRIKEASSICSPTAPRSHHARQSAAAVVCLVAYVLMGALRRLGLAHTSFASAAGSIRLKLLKIGALVTISARRVRIAFASACPNAQEWRLAAARLANARGSPA